MSYLMVTFSCVALILQLAAMRDPTIVEQRPQVYMRRVAIVAHLIAIGTGAVLIYDNDELRYPLALVVILCAIKDIFSAMYRLWPEVFEAETHERDMPARGKHGR